jgi:site-specific recombinase XerD
MAERYSDAPKCLRDFLFYMLAIRGRSPKTVDAYYTDLRTFLRYISVKKLGLKATPEETDVSGVTVELLSSVTLSDVYDFLNYTLTERENTAKTRARKVSSLRSFFRFLTVKEHAFPDNPVQDLELPAIKKSLPKHLTLEESLELMGSVDSRYPYRDYCILTLLLNCGMRLSELVGVNLQDIRENTVRLLGKGNKERIVYLNDACLYALSQYMPERGAIRGAGSDKALFLSSRGTRITPRRVEQIVEGCLKAAELDGHGYSPHKLRHTAATLMYQHGQVDIRVLKEILGHANLATTELYTHVSDRQIESAASRNPLSGVKMSKKMHKP